eukprot:m.72918 g.72918  ORF g.72918 m.72918 type:complete len:247 (-) comp50260_c0_seq1:195-935(-)
MGGVASAVAVVGAAVASVLFTKKPARPRAIEPRPGKTLAQLIQEAHSELGLDAVNHYNIAFCGPAGSGKSTLINMFLGVKDTDPGAAPVGVTECTMSIKKYDHPNIPHLKLWDIPGAGTGTHPAATYFSDKRLYAFDAILVLSAGRFLEVSQQIAEGATESKRTIAFLWAKADLSFADLREASPADLSDEEVRTLLRQQVNESFDKNKLSSHRLFLVSAREAKRGSANFDEESLLGFIKEAAGERH